jgi:transposase
MAKPKKVLIEDLWEIIEPMLPKQKAPGTPGRPPVPNRTALLGILYVLLNGCPWNAVPMDQVQHAGGGSENGSARALERECGR